MRFERLRLSNFKCYADTDLRLTSGVTVIHGLNGSGKSSLLEACFFALYGARALDRTLDEVITIGAEEAAVELWFSHAGGDYRIERELTVRGGSATTTTCVLEGPEATVDGARDVRAAVADLLRMDASAFVNCAYVRQGEVNKLINASPGERQDMIDDLLQLGKLEDYRERASDARVGVGRVRDNKQGALEDVEAQVAAKEDEDLHDRLNALKSELADVQADIERFEENREKARTQRDEAAETLAEYEERQAELAGVEDDVEELTDDIAAAESERSEKADRIAALRERADDLRAEAADLLADTELDADDAAALPDGALDERLADLRERKDEAAERIREQSVEVQKHAGDAENARERADELESEAEAKREEADELEADLADARDDLAETRERIGALGDEIEDTRATFEDAPVEPDGAESHRDDVAERLNGTREELAGVEADLSNAREAVAEAERLLEEGKCPECGQPVDDSPHVDSVEADRERVADLAAEVESLVERRDDLRETLDRAEELVAAADELADLRDDRDRLRERVAERESLLDDREARVETLRGEAETLGAEAESKREEVEAAAARADAARDRMGELNGESADLKRAIERVESLADLLDDVAEAESEVESLREARANLADRADLLRERLSEKRERKAELAEALDEGTLDAAEEKKEKAEAYLSKVEPKLDGLTDERDELQTKIGGVEGEIARLGELRERRDELAETVERLDSLYREARTLQETYADLRAELRQRNVRKLERMLNETFELVYGNDAYSHIELDGEYALTVYQKDGEPLDPEQLSGGERAVFNLSLRCAIYRLLAEGIDGAAPMPPLILDEPTVFLDSGHVSKLVGLIESMTELGVDQILVVSHDDELVGAADELVTVRKDPTSNRSSVERADAADAAALSAFN
ncbi:DNA double-strand break repair ATPase Rad50 [Halosegnis marinus]|uniref:DNA double-strand break repair Rad50 ATPase n=1 Tax=Halosegnis marinus TaxID=3034023 RepID=A0ABD5ZQN4_9EURY|nr:DNA double-strand break repair ATPase Rad50 [Halosegnis sp. DT85]